MKKTVYFIVLTAIVHILSACSGSTVYDEYAHTPIAAIPVYAVTDTLRYIDQHGGGKNVLRSDYRVVQTPQTFDIGLAKQAFNQEYKEQFTDDASVVESLGCQVAMVEGNRENIKITTPFDIKIAEALLG